MIGIDVGGNVTTIASETQTHVFPSHLTSGGNIEYHNLRWEIEGIPTSPTTLEEICTLAVLRGQHFKPEKVAISIPIDLLGHKIIIQERLQTEHAITTDNITVSQGWTEVVVLPAGYAAYLDYCLDGEKIPDRIGAMAIVDCGANNVNIAVTSAEGKFLPSGSRTHRNFYLPFQAELAARHKVDIPKIKQVLQSGELHEEYAHLLDPHILLNHLRLPELPVLFTGGMAKYFLPDATIPPLSNARGALKYLSRRHKNC